MTATERFQRWMQVSAALYALGGLTFAVLPRWSFALGDRLYRQLPGLADWPAPPETAVFAWTVLAVSMMATITTCCFLAARAPGSGRLFAVPVIVSKGLSSVGGLFLLAVHAKYPIYLGLFLTDFPLLVITWVLFRATGESSADAP
ncbi:MAG TPA: hypothetical protein DIU15_13310 [Deltaproteobacteria bacterium]|nr:hypothetical protein [Deltaproteobacteria bacterium]HCP47018.1 hypothetical protein [Deltaproteobacteria bacterium]